MNEKLTEKDLLERARNICSSREYCTSDMSAKLSLWGAKEEEVIKRILKKLKDEKFIDEERYCRAYAVDHFRYQHWGRIRIVSGLKMKKIPDQIIKPAIEAIDEEEYLRSLRTIIASYRRTVKAKNRYDLKGKLLRHALSKGFESHLVYDILNEVSDD